MRHCVTCECDPTETGLLAGDRVRHVDSGDTGTVIRLGRRSDEWVDVLWDGRPRAQRHSRPDLLEEPQ